MASKHAAFVKYVAEDLLAGLGPVKIRPMFGGHGLYFDGLFFALEADGKIYFKTDATNQKEFEEAGSKPFTYSAKGEKSISMGYWSIPEEVLEDHELMVEWASKSIRVARTAKAKKKK